VHHDVRLHTHLAETLDEEDFCKEMFGLRPLDYLESVGWLTGRTWLGHGIHLDDEEIARLGAAGTGVAHCPTSNMRLASGTARVLELEAAGVPVGLGVDGSASNDASNMILEARQALYLQRLRYGAAAVTCEQALGWATRGSAGVLGRSDIGQLAPGLQADLALFRLDELRFSGSHDPVGAAAVRRRPCRPRHGRRPLARAGWPDSGAGPARADRRAQPLSPRPGRRLIPVAEGGCLKWAHALRRMMV
jgi:8-oxoguanine deaminase